MFGALFLAAFLTWMYYAFIQPPIFSRRNARRFANTLYHLVVKGNDAELSVIANELGRSATSLIKISRRLAETPKSGAATRRHRAEDYAHDLLLLLANRKLCRHIVESSPVTALAFFESMTRERKYDIPIGQFAKSISTEAIANKNSIMYGAGEGFDSGLIGYLKPWTQTIYGNFDLLETLGQHFGSPLDIDYRAMWAWDAEQWGAYTRATLAALKGYLASGNLGRSFAIYRALTNVEGAFRDVYKLDRTTEEPYENDIYERLRVAVTLRKRRLI